MARKVFFSFKYDDVQRAMNVRNSNVIEGDKKSGFIDKAAFEKVEKNGYGAIKKWIDKQLEGTTVTVVLVGKNTHKSRWVKYEIDQSIARGNGIITIDISKIPDLQENTTDCCSLRVPDCDHYQWNNDKGRKNLGKWVESAAEKAGK
ncbi:MTH538 TIR-like domain (plasmid) [Zymomonas mobilis subsp. mobilis ZM4 = ATCC 31821]|uniref:TIR domain-containing protein n=1 Tax=Zymomonas mobilis TaxID=542 RepID=UPI0007849BDF|nr:TIR domain-containing protein [Zymomonas mobilis]AVZ26813.1 TIR-like domain protein [Zymomonas mobilis subsp. mobilis]AVZ28699.1 MTH538 TIR-like domain [Zymomonas mobilis subsp. mobilis]AVZ43145.1 MTH538 TIR-like domain [Zymomonas mobilis subsp. mobilis ZM4 = ATCC 31821]UBQ08777.1 TIR domain-containing protein [Zymomonas mobilis]